MATITIDVPDEVAQALIEKYSKKEFPRWRELGKISGYYLSTYSYIWHRKNYNPQYPNRNLRATKELAEASIAMAQLSQLMKHCNGDWIPDWTDDTDKYIINIYRWVIKWGRSRYYSYYLSFPREEKRDWFLEKHR